MLGKLEISVRNYIILLLASLHGVVYCEIKRVCLSVSQSASLYNHCEIINILKLQTSPFQTIMYMCTKLYRTKFDGKIVRILVFIVLNSRLCSGVGIGGIQFTL